MFDFEKANEAQIEAINGLVFEDIELENYIICKPHSDCVKKVSE